MATAKLFGSPPDIAFSFVWCQAAKSGLLVRRQELIVVSVMIAVTCTSETITCSRRRPQQRYLLNAGYPAVLAEVGAQAAVLPHAAPIGPAQAAQIMASFAGLVVSGGDFDVPPRLYGEAPHARLGRLDPMRTAFEAALCRAALDAKKPVLGVCGGMQLLNVLYGGTLVQDLSLWPNALPHEQDFDRARSSHPVTLAPGSRLSAALTAGRPYRQAAEVNSSHHQVIGKVGAGLSAVAYAPDGVVEAIEGPVDGPFVLGVQWHPEAMADGRQAGIFRAFVDACRT